ncbi:alpha/beta hydrolase [Streptomyces hyaluromycini]|uniref:alpha/beta hydrolase n=1 Tax=Streptomyces hyaluromycini TaxID=1377993 RepID=UPI000B5CFEB1|nr:alpha/beta hydrolase [Streptomyces hyaluromycini]
MAKELAAPVRALLEQYRSMGEGVQDIEAALPQLRAWRAPDLSDGPVDDVEISDIVIENVPVRLYRPAGDGGLALHVYFHGGGFVLGSALAGDLDGLLSRRAHDAACLVASVEYRLAPEHRFPAGADDCYTALRGLVADAERHGIARDAVTVGGVSAGGNLAAVVALMARDLDGPAIALHLLEAAGTDVTKTSSAWRHPRPEHDTTREADLAMIDLYLSSLAERAHPYASPLFAPGLDGVAPAYLVNAEFDPRRDECEAYAARLRDAGVQAVSRTLPGHVHGSCGLPDRQPARDWRAAANAVLASANAAARAGRPLRLTAP